MCNVSAYYRVVLQTTRLQQFSILNIVCRTRRFPDLPSVVCVPLLFFFRPNDDIKKLFLFLLAQGKKNAENEIKGKMAAVRYDAMRCGQRGGNVDHWNLRKKKNRFERRWGRAIFTVKENCISQLYRARSLGVVLICNCHCCR